MVTIVDIPANITNYRIGRTMPILMWCLHTMEGKQDVGTEPPDYDAENVAHWMQTPNIGVSTHYGVDDDSIVQSVAQRSVAFTIAPWNDCTVSVEQAGYAAWSTGEWFAHANMLENVAQLMAQECTVPLVILDATDIIDYYDAHQQLPQGITTHYWLNQVTKHYGDTWCKRVLGRTTSDTSHTDPGPNYPIDWVVNRAVSLRYGNQPQPGDEFVTIFATDGQRVVASTIAGEWHNLTGDDFYGARGKTLQDSDVKWLTAAQLNGLNAK